MRGRGRPARVVLWTLAFALALPAWPAWAAGESGAWSRVLELKPYTPIAVTRAGDVIDGWFASADAEGISVGIGPPREGGFTVTYARDQVRQVAVVRTSRPWYAVPAVVGAAIAGAAVAIGVLWAVGKHAHHCDSCAVDDSWLAVVIGMPIAAGASAYHKYGPRRSLKVIYEAGTPVE